MYAASNEDTGHGHYNSLEQPALRSDVFQCDRLLPYTGGESHSGKKARGRPKKTAALEANGMPKRPRGRPRIHPPKDPNAPRRPRGRPRKSDMTSHPSPPPVDPVIRPTLSQHSQPYYLTHWKEPRNFDESEVNKQMYMTPQSWTTPPETPPPHLCYEYPNSHASPQANPGPPLNPVRATNAHSTGNFNSGDVIYDPLEEDMCDEIQHMYAPPIEVLSSVEYRGTPIGKADTDYSCNTDISTDHPLGGCGIDPLEAITRTATFDSCFSEIDKISGIFSMLNPQPELVITDDRTSLQELLENRRLV